MKDNVYTVIDACVNRAIEGLRVCEDIFRFALHHPVSSEFKVLRHSIRDAVSKIPVSQLLDSRDIGSDSQKFIDTAGESERAGLPGVFRANIRRAAEAARSLEEIFKINDPAAGAIMQSVRFRIYEVEKNCWFILQRANLEQRINKSLCAVIDPESTGSVDPVTAVSDAAGKGAGIILLKLPEGAESPNLAIAKKISALCMEQNILYFVYSRPDIAVLSGATGICLGTDDFSVADTRRITGNEMLVGITAADERSICDAIKAGADFIVYKHGADSVMMKCPFPDDGGPENFRKS